MPYGVHISRGNDDLVYLVVRIRGIINIPFWANKTLEGVNLRKKFNATILKEDTQTLGMLRKVKDIVAWKSIDDDSIIKELLIKKGKQTMSKSLTSYKSSEYESIDNMASSIYSNNLSLSNINGVKPWFSLNPPMGGFKRKTKTQYSQNGILGNNNELVDLVRRMI